MRRMKRILVLLVTFTMVFSNTPGMVLAGESNEEMELIQDAAPTDGTLQKDSAVSGDAAAPAEAVTPPETILPADTALPAVFTLTFDGGGAAPVSAEPIEPVSVTAGEWVELPDNYLFIPPACHVFAGWKIAELGEDIYSAATTLQPAQSLTAVAQWTEDPNAHQWNVTWNWAEDGSNASAVISCALCGHTETIAVDSNGISVAEFEDRYEYTAGIQINGVPWSDTMVIMKQDTMVNEESAADTMTPDENVAPENGTGSNMPAEKETAAEQNGEAVQNDEAVQNVEEEQNGDVPTEQGENAEAAIEEVQNGLAKDGLAAKSLKTKKLLGATGETNGSGEEETEEEENLRNTAGTAVAKIGEKEYSSLAEAVEAAGEGNTIELLANVEETVVIPAGKSLILDLGTSTVTAPAGSVAITNNGTLTIQGSGSVIANGNYAVSNHGSELTINGGNFSKTDPSASQSLIANGWYNAADNTGGTGSQMIINGGTFDGGSYTAVKNDSYGYLTINGGTINSTNASAGVQESGSQLIINGGELNANVALTTASSVAGEQKQVSLSGGTFNKNVQTLDVAGAAAASEIQVTLGSGAAFNGSLSLAQPNRTTKIAMDHNISGLTIDGTLTLGGYLSDSQSDPFNLTNITANNITLTSVDPAKPSILSGCTVGNTVKAGTVTLANTTAKVFECNTKNAAVTVGEGSTIETMRVTTNTGSAIVIDGGSVNSIANVGKAKIGGYESITVNSGTVGSIETSKGNVTVNGGNVDTITISEKFANTNDITVTVADSDAVGQVVNKRASDTSAAAQTNIVLTDPDGEKVYDESTGTYTFKEKKWLLTLAASSAVYTGSDLTPAVTVQYGETGEPLTPGSDYELSWQDDAGNDAPELINAGTYTVTASGLGTYAEQTKTAEFTVQQASGRKVVDSITGEEKTFTGSPLESTFTFLDEEGNTIQLEENKDYKIVSYSNNTNAGEASALISYLGNYKGTDRAAFTIKPADLSITTVTIPEGRYIDGEGPFEPKATVKLGEYTLTESDYTATYSNNETSGTATVTINPGTSGNFIGNNEGTFQITAPIQSFGPWSVDSIYYFADEDPIPERKTQVKAPTKIKRKGSTSLVPISEEDNISFSWTITKADAADSSEPDTSIASVDENGMITFAVPGKVRVWLTMTEPNGAEKTAYKEVSYSEAPAYVTRKDGEKVAYASLLQAMNKAEDGEKVTLCKDNNTTNIGKITISGGKSITLDLNGHSVNFNASYRKDSFGAMFTVKNGSLTVVNSGMDCGVYASGTNARAFNVDGTTNASSLTISEGVSVSSAEDCCVTVFGNASLNTAGDLSSPNDFAISGNGSAGNDGTVINVTGGSVSSGSTAIYHPQAGQLTINGGTVTGDVTGIEMRAGTLTVNNGAVIKSTYSGEPSSTANGSGTTTSGAAVAIAQHTTKLPVSVTINGGLLEGPAAVYESNPQGNDGTALAFVTAEIKDGILKTTLSDGSAVFTEDKNVTISGGVYSDNTDKTNVAVPEGKMLVKIPENETNAGLYRLADFFTVTFDPNNGDEMTIQKVISGEKAVKPEENPVKADNIFKGWYLDAAKYNFDTPVTENITLKALWTADKLQLRANSLFASANKNAVTNGEELAAFIVKLNGKTLSKEELAKVTWSSSDPEIASIDRATGKIKPGAKTGEATITAVYDGLEATGTVTVTEALAQVDEVGYATAAAALNAINGTTGKTVKVLKDHTLSGTLGSATLKAGGKYTLDLDGKTLTMKLAGITLNGASLTVTNGTIHNSSDDRQAFIVNSGELTIDSKATVSAEGTGNAVGVFGPATVNTAGTLMSGNSFAITGDGSEGKGGYTVNVTGGTITASNAPAIYHPNAGTLNISGGTITGTTAVYQKAGELKITDGTLRGTGEKTDYTYYGSGAIATGDALVIDNCGYPGGEPVVSITGGEFISDNADAVGTYSYGDGKEPKEGFIAGGEFSNVVPEKLCAEGYAPVEDKDSKQLYPVHRHIDHLCHVEAVGASCTEDGNTEYWYCEICDAYFSDAGAKTEITDKERVKVPATDHEYEYAVLIPPTCTQMGVKKGVCKHNEEHTILELIDATGHTLQRVEAKPATCKEEGSAEHWVCTKCGELFADEEGTKSLTEEKIKVAKLAHTPGNPVKENEVAGSCSKKGSYDEVIYCTVCKEEISRTHKEDSATGEHSWGAWTEVIKATCTSNGLRYRTCKNDEAHKDYEVLPVKTTHRLERIPAKAATCTEAGTGAYYRCADCGKMFSDAAGTRQISAAPAVKATGHVWGAPVWTWSSDRSIAVARFTCTKCPETKTEIATVKSSTTAAKPGVAGKTDYVASVSLNGKTYTDVKSTPIPALPTEVKATGVSLNTAAKTMSESDTTTLAATVAPSNATNKKVNWSSNNPAVATVDANGKVTTKAPGTAVITATAADGSGKSASCTVTAKKASVSYRTHVQTYGWQSYVKDGAMSGTQGQSKRLEGINIKLENLPYAGNIVYRTHVQTYGWQDWKQNDAMSGTQGQSKRLEGIQIYLTGELAKHYDIYYRVHAQTYGWLGWAKNGVMAGTSGLSRRLEGINIVLVPKGGAAPGSTERSSICGNGTTLPPNPYKEP